MSDENVSDQLGWLADAPLFIDDSLIERFYDAVVRPIARQGSTKIELTEESATKLAGKLGIKGSASPTKVAQVLYPILALLNVKLEGSAEAEMSRDKKKGKKITLDLEPIQTPQRQLEQLALYYLFNLTERTFFVKDSSHDNVWRSPAEISKTPRSLVFLDLPSYEEAVTFGRPVVKLIPTAAEFVDGSVQLFFTDLGSENDLPPKYPDKPASLVELTVARKAYWKWFETNFNATKAIIVVEEKSRTHGKIQWIDYRLPLDNEGDTLHLHISPGGKWDTGAFAYNFIKRGYKHGIRIVGTVKSEPDINVLAIYDK